MVKNNITHDVFQNDHQPYAEPDYFQNQQGESGGTNQGLSGRNINYHIDLDS